MASNSSKVLRWLATLGAGERGDIERADAQRRTPLFAAVCHGQLTVCARRTLATPLPRRSERARRRRLRPPLAAGWMPRAPSSSPRRDATRARRPLPARQVVRYLCDAHSADPDARDTDGRTALWAACALGQLEEVQFDTVTSSGIVKRGHTTCSAEIYIYI